jgi:choline monooxygenase
MLGTRPVTAWDDRGVARSGTLPSDWYTSQELFDLEQRTLFRRVWTCVGRTEQVAQPGDFFTCEVANEQVIVARDKSGTLRALSNTCLHRAGPVALECGHRKAFQCPYHGWTYELDGRLRRCQGMEGTEDFAPEEMRLPQFRVDTWGPLVWVTLEDSTPPLEEWLGQITPRMANYRLEEMEFIGGRTWMLPCNWKMYVDNYMEGYHIPFIHPGLAQALSPTVYTYDVGTWSNVQYGAEPHPRGPGSRVAGILGSVQALRRLKPPMPGLDEQERSGYFFFWLFPHHMLNLTPDGFLLFSIKPVAPELTQSTFLWWMPTPTCFEDRLLQAGMINFGHVVNTEDAEIVAHAQKGMRSSVYSQGRYAAQQEMCLHHFHRLLVEQMEPEIEKVYGASGNGRVNGARPRAESTP